MSKSDVEIARIVTDFVNGSDHPDLVVYRKDFGTKFDLSQWIGGMRKRCDLSGLYNKRILEVGCGFGWDAAALSLIGNNVFFATDILPSMIDGVRDCLASLAAKGVTLDIEPMQGDICTLDLPAASFDAIYSSEAIEHVHDLAAMFERCRYLLRTGGTLVIYNDSNRFNSEFRESTFGMWKDRDESWEHAAWLKAEIRPVEHVDAKPYAAMRETIIREAAPDLDDAGRDALVHATAGLIRREILAAVGRHAETGALPVRPTFSWCRNPETGEYAERLLDPFELTEMLREAGFANVRLRHVFNRFPHRFLNGVRFRPLNEFLFDKRGIFAITADKR